MANQRDLFMSPSTREVALRAEMSRSNPAGWELVEARGRIAALEAERDRYREQARQFESAVAALSDTGSTAALRSEIEAFRGEYTALVRNKRRADEYASRLTGDNVRLTDQVAALARQVQELQAALAAPAGRRTNGSAVVRPAEGDRVVLDESGESRRPSAGEASAQTPEGPATVDGFDPADRFAMLEM